MTLTGQDYVFKFYFLTNEQVTGQHKELTSQHKSTT